MIESYEVPVQYPGKHVCVDHPAIPVEQRGKRSLRCWSSFKLGAAGFDLEIDDVVGTVPRFMMQ
jgi:hypothetical protein